MPIQKTDRNTTWAIDADGKTWTLARKATITVDNLNGITENGHSDSDIRALGDIVVKGAGYAGIRVTGADSSALVGEASRIDARQADYGIFSDAAGSDITNRGVIDSGGDGIHGAVWNDVLNFGTIKGLNAMSFGGSGSQIHNYGQIEGKDYGIRSPGSDTYVQNARGAEISADGIALALEGSGVAEVVNRGVIRSKDIAIQGDGGVTDITNAGRIVGDVHLGAGADVFDSRKGTIQGKVFGGDGGDDYYVGAARVKIVEASGGAAGIDEVFATASHRLAANVEVLDLIGKKNIDGAGNGGQNWIYDNKGDNILRGGGGDDRLYASGGDDTLTGNGGQDYFVFSPGGVDRITDFEDMLDLVAIDGVQTQADFDALDIRQVKGDVVIDFGGGDKVIIEDLLASNFDFNDISVN